MGPFDGAVRKLPLTFHWKTVEGADSYIIQFAKDKEMTQIVFAQETTENSFDSQLRINLSYLPYGDYYWRVKTRIPNAGDTWSQVHKITIALENSVEDIDVKNDHIEKMLIDGKVYIKRQEIIYDILGNIIN